MVSRVEFTCGEVVPKERPRRAPAGHFYTPPETKKSQAEIAMCALVGRNRAGIFSPTLAPVTIWAYLAVRNKGDIDNGLKTVKDALEGIIYENDRQVSEAHVFRQDGHRSRVVVEWAEGDRLDQGRLPPVRRKHRARNP